MSSFKTPLGKVRGLGSAHTGTSHWIAQRCTAILNLFLLSWLIFSSLTLVSASYEDAVIWLSTPINALAIIAFICSGFYHAKLGLQVVVEDYIHCKCGKIFALLCVYFICYGSILISIFSILKVIFTVSGSIGG